MLFVGLVIGVIAFAGISAFFGAPYVPSRRRHVEELFDKHYKLRSSDVVLDLGSGDGSVVREVARRGARAVGVEIHPLFYAISVVLSRRYRSQVRLQLGNIWRYSFPEDTTVVYAFSVSRDIKRMYQRVCDESSRLGRPLTFICYGAHLHDIKADSSSGAFNIYHVNGESALQRAEA